MTDWQTGDRLVPQKGSQLEDSGDERMHAKVTIICAPPVSTEEMFSRVMRLKRILRVNALTACNLPGIITLNPLPCKVQFSSFQIREIEVP